MRTQLNFKEKKYNNLKEKKRLKNELVMRKLQNEKEKTENKINKKKK